MSGVRLEVVDVTKRFGATVALDRVSFALEPGERLAVLGPSGCGKTTLIRVVAGLELPDEGEVRFDGQLVSRPGWAVAPHRRRIGVAFQLPALWPHMTAAENVRFGLHQRSRAQAEARVRDALALVELSDKANRYPDQLSGGEARRVALARALAPEPRLLLLDEPLANLGGALRERLLAAIRNAAAETRCTLVYVTHEPAEAAAVADRTLTLDSEVQLDERTEPARLA